MTVLITGGSGGLGGYAVHAFEARGFTVLAPTRVEMPLEDEDRIAAYLTDSVHGVIHLAALADVPTCQRDPRQAVAINTRGTVLLAQACARYRLPMIYMSTDAAVRPDTVYGWSKMAGEQAVSMLGTQGLIVRANFFTRKCKSKTSFAEYVVRSASAGVDCPCYTDVLSRPVFAGTLADRLAILYMQRASGIHHVVSSDTVDRMAQARMICEEYGLPIIHLRPAERRVGDGDGCLPGHGVGDVRNEIVKMVEKEPLTCGEGEGR